MKKPAERHTDNFTVDFGGKSYACERIIIGADRLTQRIHVIGVGSKDDSATYGLRGHPVETMSSIARIIAGEILGAADPRLLR
ncbi:MAG: hypothetical protein WDM86_16075 [Rhizomicrobium sp.]